MHKFLIVIIFSCCISYTCFAQADSIFDRIVMSVQDFKLDTSAVLNDKVTKKIRELRSLRGGFNINEALSFKLEEGLKKGEISQDEFNKVSDFFKLGQGKIWLDNAMNSIYRKHFTYAELKQLTRFYKTSAGKKMAIDFPIIMMQSIRATELIKEIYVQMQEAMVQE